MKKLIALAALASAVVATPVLARDVTLEGRFSDLTGGRNDTTEIRAEYNDGLAGILNYGVELQTIQGENAGEVGSLLSAKLGTDLKGPLGFTVTPRGEVGYGMRTGDNFEFWGAGVTVTRPLFGVVSGEVGYRHREAFDAVGFNEERLHAGVGVALTDTYTVRGTYYRTRGTTDSDTVGVGITAKF